MAEQKNSTWRERRLTLNPGLNEYQFPDTRPNHVVVNNLGAASLYFGNSVIPNETAYEKKIEPFGENMYSRDTGISRCSIYNSSTSPVEIILTSFLAEFNPATIANTTINNSSGGSNGGSVTINGFSTPLPAGSNNLGKVVVTEMPLQKIEMQSLPAGINNIGKVDVAKIPPLAEGVSHIGRVTVDNGLTITNMPPMQLAGNVTLSDTSFDIKSKDSFYTYNGSVSTTDVSIPFTPAITCFKYITNDDNSNDLLIAFNTSTTTASQQGLNGVIVLKPNETINELNIKSSSITFKRLSGSGNVRFLGV